jgi:hypothetical protein
MAETSRDRIEQRRIALSVLATAVNYVRDGLAMAGTDREDWLRILDNARDTVAQLDREAREDLQRTDRRRR